MSMSGSGVTPVSGNKITPPETTTAAAVATMGQPRRSDSDESNSSAERLLQGQEPSFFSVVMRPRRALRVVNGLEEELERES